MKERPILFSGPLVKALSLWQPWASLMAAGIKKIETRGWATHYRGPLAIHAAKRPLDRENRDLYQKWIDAGLIQDLEPMPFGAIVAVVELVQCIPTYDTQAFEPLEREFGNFALGRWAWITQDVRRLENPIPYRGAQGLFEVPYSMFNGGLVS